MSAFFHPHKFRRLIARRGETCRWFKAFRATDYDAENNVSDDVIALPKIDGWVYIEHATPTQPCIFIDEEKRSIADEQFGFLQVGEAAGWTMPADLPLTRPDRIVLDQRNVLERELLSVTDIATGENDLSPGFRRQYVKGVTAVVQGTRVFEKDVDYQYSPLQNRLVFADGATHRPQLTAGFAMISVEYQFAPAFFFNGQQHTSGRPSRYEELLPQRGLLVVRHPDRSDPAL